MTLAAAFYAQSIDVEAFTGRDGQGAPSYATKDTEIKARFEDGATFEIETEDGAQVMADATCYVPGDASTVPAERDRVTGPDGETFIVAAREDGIGVGGSLDHVKLGLREA